MTLSTPSFLTLARLARLAALLLFLTPWANASCVPGPAAQNMAASSADDARWTLRATGAELAAGTAAFESGISLDAMPPNPFAAPDPAILAALALLLASLAATFIRRRALRAAAAMAGLVLAAAALCFALPYHFPRVLTAWVAQGARGNGVTTAADLARLAELRIHVELGFWLTLAALGAALLFDIGAWWRVRPAGGVEPGGLLVY